MSSALSTPFPAFAISEYAIYIVLGIFTTILSIDWAFFSRSGLPPGPQRLPIFGNILQVPKSQEWFHWAKFLETYGPISSVTVMGQPIIILNDLESMLALMDKKSRVYSERPLAPLAGELIGWNRQMILSPVNDHFYAMRKLVAKHIGTKSSLSTVAHVQENYMRLLLARLLEKPSEYLDSIRLFQGAFFLRISHGYIVDTTQADPLVSLIEKAAREFYIATQPGAWLVDIFPSMLKLPRWFPGTNFRQVGEKFRKTNEAQADIPYEWVKKQVANGTALPSFTSGMLQEDTGRVNEEAIKYVSNTLYGGGTDTISVTIATFFLAMTIYPEVQKKAQAEIDAAVGLSRLPNSQDRDSLPYINALMKELLRWHVAGPMGIPHRSSEDAVYNGHFIPKGAILLSNLWKVSQDSTRYADPETFRPERFLGVTPELDPHTWAFGFGRRRCPGIEMADASVFIAVAMILAVFNVEPVINLETGLSEIPVHAYGTGTVCYPEPFKCDIKVRSVSAEALIRTVCNEDQLPSSRIENISSYIE